MPPPEPRSRTVSPGLSWASAVGLPQPSEAFRAASGTRCASAVSYRLAVMGSQQPSRATELPQQELPAPVVTRSAASPYFSFTTSLMFRVVITFLLSADLNYLFRFDSFVSGAALVEEEAEQFLQRAGVGCVPEKRALTADRDQVLVLQLVEMMRQCGAGNLQLAADIADHHTFRVSGKQQAHDTKTGLGAHGREHVGTTGDLGGIGVPGQRDLLRYFHVYRNIETVSRKKLVSSGAGSVLGSDGGDCSAGL